MNTKRKEKLIASVKAIEAPTLKLIVNPYPSSRIPQGCRYCELREETRLSIDLFL